VNPKLPDVGRYKKGGDRGRGGGGGHLVGSEPDAEDLELVGDEGLQAEDHQIHHNGVPRVPQPREAIRHEASHYRVYHHKGGACRAAMILNDLFHCAADCEWERVSTDGQE